MSLKVFEDGSWHGFVDSVLNGAGAMRALVSVGLIVFGVLVPFLPLIAAVIALLWCRHRSPAGAYELSTGSGSPKSSCGAGAYVLCRLCGATGRRRCCSRLVRRRLVSCRMGGFWVRRQFDENRWREW